MRRIFFALLIAALAGGVGPVASSAGAVPSGCPGRAGLGPATLPAGTDVVRCGLVGAHYRVGRVQLQIPAPGHGAGVAAVSGEGGAGETMVSLSVLPDGTVRTSAGLGSVTAAARAGQAAAATGACRDRSYALWDAVWDRPVPWSLNRSGQPFSNTQTLAGLKFSMRAITSADDCGMADKVSLQADYQGTTDRTANVSAVSDGSGGQTTQCGDDNGFSDVDFGDLGDHFIGVTCSWWLLQPEGPAILTSADVRINVVDARWTRHGESSRCRRKYDFEAVAVHEFGHLAGLLHVEAGKHANQTMYPVTFFCDERQQTLGKGDILGLRARY